jgi:hypothetical protein
MKRRIHAIVTSEYWIELDIDSEEQTCADPDGDMSDGEAAALAISSALGAQKHEVQVFGPNVEPAVVFREHVNIRIDGTDDDA